MIVEEEQNGENRADYPKEIIKKLSSDLTKEFNRGYSVSNLEYFRKFYFTYQHRIPNTLSGKYPISDKSEKSLTVGISQTAFSLSWSHMIKTEEENQTIGIILCKEENKAVVEFTLPENNKTIFAKEYKQVLPSKAELRKQLE